MSEELVATTGPMRTAKRALPATALTPATAVLAGPPNRAPRHRTRRTQAKYEGGTRLPLDYLPIPAFNRAAVRAFDILVASIALALLLPLFALIVVAIGTSSSGAPVYAHRRLGRHGRYFSCLKFRSMYIDADQRLSEILQADPVASAQWREHQKLKNDPRITPLGRFLRVTNLDEFPQLLNVLRGQMSIVGPRPIVDDEARRYGKHLSVMLAVKPGLTGLWQVSGRNDLSYAERVALDLEYVRTRSLRRDIIICLTTALQMIRFRSNGAY